MHDKTSLENGFIHIFTDGSFNQKLKRLGTGVVIVENESILEIRADGLHVLPKKTPRSYVKKGKFNYTAEYMAATAGLNTLPKNSKVILHTDLIDLAKIVSDHAAWSGTLFSSLKSSNTPMTKSAIVSLLNAVQRHDIVLAEVVNDKITDDIRGDFMRVAHIAARVGAKIIKTPEKYVYEQTETPIQWLPRLDKNDLS